MSLETSGILIDVLIQKTAGETLEDDKKDKIVRFNREFPNKELYQQIRYTINKYWDMSLKFNIENADGTKRKYGI